MKVEIESDTRLAALIGRHREAVAAELAMHAQALTGTPFARTPLGEVRGQMLAVVEAIECALAQGNLVELKEFGRRFSAGLRSKGFALPEVQRALARFRMVMVPRIVTGYAGGPAEAAAAMALIDDIVDSVLFTVSESYLESATGEFRHLLHEQEREMATLREQSQRDSLTHLYHQAYFYEVLSSECERSRRYGREFSLIMLDIDNFKSINDHHGHQAGDRTLVAVAEAFTRVLRVSDVLTRYGGEEFAVILPETPWEQGFEVALKLLSACEALRVDGAQPRQIRITCSAGVAGFPQHAGDTALLVASADGALYAAKAAGRNRVLVAHTLAERGTAREKPGASLAASAE